MPIVSTGVTEDMIAVVKVKQTTEDGFEFEHLSIRGYDTPICVGCQTHTIDPHNPDYCYGCTDKTLVYSISVKATEAERAANLKVSFEFQINGQQYVTRTTRTLTDDPTKTAHRDHITNPFAIELKKFNILCPRDEKNILMHTGTVVCPFEGNMQATFHMKARQKDSDVVMSDTFLYRESVGANRESVSYTISPHRNTTTHVTVTLAKFNQCYQDGVLFAGCSGNGWRNFCDAGMWETVPILQSDALYVTKTSATGITTYLYNKSNPIESVAQQETYTMHAESDSLRIDLMLDEYECKNSLTHIQITIHYEDSSGSDDGGSDNGGSDDGGSNSGGSDSGGSDSGGSDSGGNDNDGSGSGGDGIDIDLDRLAAFDAAVPICPTIPQCYCTTPISIPNTEYMPWPHDECNQCVFGRYEVCGNQGLDYIITDFCMYNVYVEHNPIDLALALGVAKIKQSKAIEHGGVPYEHLTIRHKPILRCVGCFSQTDCVQLNQGCGEVLDKDLCSTCPADQIIYFWTFMPRMLETEVWKHEVNQVGDLVLVVHFEFWMKDTFYVTRYTDLLNEVPGNDAGTWTRQKNNYLVPKSITLDEKMFDMICSTGNEANGDIVCPYEGDAVSALDIVLVDETEGKSTYWIRKISKILFVTLETFALPKCEQALVWNVFEYGYGGIVSSYSCDPDWESGDPGEDGLYGYGCNYENPEFVNFAYEDGLFPHVQTDVLNVTYYNRINGRQTTTYLAETAFVARTWTLSANDDLLEIVVQTDGKSCNTVDFDIKFTISTTEPITDIDDTAEIDYNAEDTTHWLDDVTGCVCNNGYGKSSGTPLICTVCPEDHWNTNSASSCQACPSNSHSGPESVAVGDCMCDNGFQFDSADSADVMHTCTPCPPGQDSQDGDTGCSDCEPGTSKKTGNAMCTSCLAGQDSQGGDAGCSDCEHGTSKKTGNAMCTSCPPGQDSQGGDAGCSDCEPGTSKKTGHAMCTSCLAGQDSQGGTAGCSDCEPGTYKTSDNARCTSCPDGKTSSAGTVSSNDCYDVIGCNLGEGYNSATQECQECADMHYKSATGNTACDPCGGNSQATDNHRQCKCKQGYSGPSNNGGVDCQVCPPNTYTSIIGMASCSTCPDESQSDTGSTQVTDCVCGPGFYMQDSLCQSCDKGKYKAGPGNAQDLCVPCTEGTYSDAMNSIACLPCTPNSQSGASSTSASDCTCDAGFHHGSDNTCVGCAPGTYQKDTAQSDCDACPVGSDSSAQSTQKASCVCTFGFTGANGGPCDAGTTGKFKPIEGSDACEDCHQHSNSAVGSTTQAACKCMPGFEQQGDARQQCPAKTFKNTTSSNPCAACDSTTQISSADFTSCVCMPGLAGPQCHQLVRTMNLQMTTEQFNQVQVVFNGVLADAYQVHVDNVSTQIITRRRHLLATIMVEATIDMGNKNVPSNADIMTSLDASDYSVQLLAIPGDDTTTSTFIGVLLSNVPFGDDIPLIIMLLALCVVCLFAVLLCIRTISGASVCCSYSTQDCFRKIRFGCLWCKCVFYRNEQDIDEDSVKQDNVIGMQASPVIPTRMCGYHSCPTRVYHQYHPYAYNNSFAEL